MDLAMFDLPTDAQPAWQARRRTPEGRYYWVPNNDLAKLHGWLIRWLRNLAVDMPYSHGAVPGRSVISNVLPHRGQRYFYQLDLSQAYQHANLYRLAAILAGYGTPVARPYEIAMWLQQYFCVTYPNRAGQPELFGLATGGPASPDLFNLYCHELIDKPIGQLIYGRDYRDLRYTRFADDLTFSSPVPIGERKRHRIQEIIGQAGFRVNPRKTHLSDLQHQAVTVCGVTIHYDAGAKQATLRPSRAARRKVRGKLEAARHGQITIPQANGHMGGLLARTPGAKRSQDPAILQLRRIQRQLLHHQSLGTPISLADMPPVQLSWDFG